MPKTLRITVVVAVGLGAALLWTRASPRDGHAQALLALAPASPAFGAAGAPLLARPVRAVDGHRRDVGAARPQADASSLAPPATAVRRVARGDGARADAALDLPPVGLSRNSIQTAIGVAEPKVLACYDSALAITPELAGKATVVFVVAADAADAVDGGPVRGHVISGEVSDSTMASPFFEARVLKEIVNLPFDAPAGGGSVTVSYPFVFALDDDNDDDDDTQAP